MADTTTVALDQVIDLTKRLSSQDKLRLIDTLAQQLLHESESARPTPRRSLRGLLADLGPAPSAEEMDEARREAWANFPREDI
ncbi:MAG TPA: hypothetical protein VGJ87_06285 [Roseiflexaceae bacterium]|jgi:hypothetical protein